MLINQLKIWLCQLCRIIQHNLSLVDFPFIRYLLEYPYQIILFWLHTNCLSISTMLPLSKKRLDFVEIKYNTIKYLYDEAFTQVENVVDTNPSSTKRENSCERHNFCIMWSLACIVSWNTNTCTFLKCYKWRVITIGIVVKSSLCFQLSNLQMVGTINPWASTQFNLQIKWFLS